jgi:hypothetical protein
VNRAERRRAEREAGRRRSSKKKGRRSPEREQVAPHSGFEALEGTGFAIANQRIWTPGEHVR